MPNRILKESITTSRTIDQLSLEEERLFYRLLVVCDDYGRFEGEPSIILGRCFPRKIGQITVDEVGSWLLRLIDVGLLRHYTTEGAPYVEFVTWERHQPTRTVKSKYPNPDPEADDPTLEHLKSPEINCNQMQSDACNGNHLRPYSYSYSYSNSIHSRPERVPVPVPDELKEFDDTLRVFPTYVPSGKFYETVLENYSHLALKLEAVKMVEWLRGRRKRRCSTNFVLNWLGNAAGSAAARAGASRPGESQASAWHKTARVI